MDIIYNELNNAYEWLCSNKLVLNIDKTKFMFFNLRNTLTNPQLNIKINNIHIERVHVFNFLGLNIDENLNWKYHVNVVSNKIAKYCGILNKLKKYLPTRIMRILVFSMVHSTINYCSLPWGLKCERVSKLQKKIIRIISKSKYNSHTEPLFKQLNIKKC